MEPCRFGDGRCVLEPRWSGSPGCPVPSERGSQPEGRSSDSDTSSTSGTFSEPLPFPDGSYWDVFVTYATGTDNIFFRLVDQSVSPFPLETMSIPNEPFARIHFCVRRARERTVFLGVFRR